MSVRAAAKRGGAASLPSDHIAHYRFNAGALTVDDAGNQDLTEAGSVATRVGIDGLAISDTNGSNHVHRPRGLIPIWGNPRTFSFWSYIEWDSGWNVNTLLSMNGSWDGGHFHLKQIWGKLRFEYGGGSLDFNGVSLNAWHHVGVRVPSGGSPTADDVDVFIDGILRTGTRGDGSNQNIVTADNAPVRIGTSYWQEAELHGAMDHLRIYNRALADSEMQLLATEF